MESQTELQSMKFQELLTKIGRKIRAHDVEIFKNELELTERLPPSLLDDIDIRGKNSGLKFLKKLQKKGYLAEDNLELLKELLVAIERQDLLQELVEFEKKEKSSHDVGGAVARVTEGLRRLPQYLFTISYEATIAMARSLSQFLFTSPQAVCFGVYKEKIAHSADSLTVTLICAPYYHHEYWLSNFEDDGYTLLALSTGDKPMRPNDKAYPWFKGSYQKGTTEEFFLQFIANQLCRKELPLQKSSENDGENDSENDSTLIIKFLPSENDATVCLGTLFVPQTKLLEIHSPGETFSRRQGYLPSRPNDARPGPSAPPLDENISYV